MVRTSSVGKIERSCTRFRDHIRQSLGLPQTHCCLLSARLFGVGKTRYVRLGGDTRSRIPERRISLRFLDIILRVLKLEFPYTIGGFIKGILRGVRCTKSLRVLFLHRRPPSWTTLVLYSRAVFIFNEPA